MSSEVDYYIITFGFRASHSNHITTVEGSWLGPLPGSQSHGDSFI